MTGPKFKSFDKSSAIEVANEVLMDELGLDADELSNDRVSIGSLGYDGDRIDELTMPYTFESKADEAFGIKPNFDLIKQISRHTTVLGFQSAVFRILRSSRNQQL